MNKSRIYKIGALCLTFLGAGTFMAFDDAQTDEQKVEAAYQQLVTEFNMEQEQLCKTQALAAAQAHWTALQAEGGDASDGGTTVVTTTTGGSSSQGGGTTTTTTTTGGNDEPTTTTTPKEDPKDPQKGRDGGTTKGDADSQKGRTGGTKTTDDAKKNAEDQKRRGGK